MYGEENAIVSVELVNGTAMGSESFRFDGDIIKINVSEIVSISPALVVNNIVVESRFTFHRDAVDQFYFLRGENIVVEGTTKRL